MRIFSDQIELVLINTPRTVDIVEAWTSKMSDFPHEQHCSCCVGSGVVEPSLLDSDVPGSCLVRQVKVLKQIRPIAPRGKLSCR